MAYFVGFDSMQTRLRALVSEDDKWPTKLIKGYDWGGTHPAHHYRDRAGEI
jgi:hypothetical protein